MILNLLLVTISLISAISLAVAVTNAEAAWAVREVFRSKGMAGAPLGCAASVLGWIGLGLWTWYAVNVHDWRFAALVWIPFVTGVLGKVATKNPRSA